MENFIRGKLRIITQEQPFRKLWELFCLLKVKAYFETEGCMLNDIIDSLHNADLSIQSE